MIQPEIGGQQNLDFRSKTGEVRRDKTHVPDSKQGTLGAGESLITSSWTAAINRREFVVA